MRWQDNGIRNRHERKWGGLGALLLLALSAGCGISQTALQEAVDNVQQEVNAFSNRWEEAQLQTVALNERIEGLREEVEARDLLVEALRREIADQEEQMRRAQRYIDTQTARFSRAIETARGLQPADPEEEPPSLPARQTMALDVEGTAPERIEVTDVVAYRSAFFADKYGNIHMMPALRFSLRNRTDAALRLYIQARRVGLHDPFGVQVVELPPGQRVLPLRIPYDPEHDLIVRIDRERTHYRLKPE